MGNIYNREQVLKSSLNAFMHKRLDLPANDYYSQLDQEAFAELKSVLSEINNIFTLKITLAFAKWLSEKFNFVQDAQKGIKTAILGKPPSANGYDIEISTPFQVIAEVKCNVPINRGAKYGSAQRAGIAKDVNSLIHRKSKSSMNPEECLKFLVLLDTPAIREATQHFVKHMKQHRDRIMFVCSDTKLENKEKVYVVHLPFEA